MMHGQKNIKLNEYESVTRLACLFPHLLMMMMMMMIMMMMMMVSTQSSQAFFSSDLLLIKVDEHVHVGKNLLSIQCGFFTLSSRPTFRACHLAIAVSVNMQQT
jgi:hypothetical protein